MSTATASAWKVRHQGSPRSIEGLTLSQVVDGLTEGLWETTDEVMGPGDGKWSSIENHPQLADIAADIDMPPPPVHEDETRIDMNPLIDVALVLLIFFMLTMTYAALQKVLEMPEGRQEVGKITRVPADQVKKFTILVTARLVDGHPLIKVEDKVVQPQDLVNEMRQYVRETRKTELALDAQGVSWGTVAQIEDAAKGAGVEKVHEIVKREK